MKLNENELKEIEDTIEQYKNSDEETLYSLIYLYYPKEEGGGYVDKSLGLGAGSDQPRDKIISSGIKIFKSWERPIYEKICCEYKIGEITSEDTQTIKEVTALIIPLLPTLGPYISATALVLIIIRKGVSIFCKNCKSKYGSCN